MRKIAVALIEPEYAVNVGHVARVMKNFGLSTLVIAKPKFNMRAARRFAAHGVDVLERAAFEDFPAMRRRFDFMVATTAITAQCSSNIARSTVTPNEMSKILNKTSTKTCLVMGRDTTGLRKDELAQCDIVLRIETGSEYCTLNISHALAIILYELQKRATTGRRVRIATADAREIALAYCMQLAHRSGYADHKKTILKDALRRILGQSNASAREVSLLIGLMRRVLLALDRLEHLALGNHMHIPVNDLLSSFDEKRIVGRKESNLDVLQPSLADDLV